MKLFTLICIALATTVITISYAMTVTGNTAIPNADALYGIGSLAAMLAGLLWLAAQWRGWSPVIDLSFIIFVGLAAGGTWLGVPATWLIVGFAAMLAAWDLGNFSDRLARLETVKQQRALEQHHLQRLGLVMGIGLLLGVLAVSVEMQLNLWWGILLSALVVAGLSQIIGRLRRESD